MKILLVEDDERIAEVLAEAFAKQNYVVDIAFDGEIAWDYMKVSPYDLIILDLMLPKIDGISLCHQFRNEGHSMPILMLTAKDTSIDKIIALDAGADDYVVKPFNLQELMARTRALLRRGNITLPSILEWEQLRLNSSICKVTYLDKLLHLTPTEYRVLKFLIHHNHRTFSRSEIVEHLWSFEKLPGDETVKVHIRSLRQKLKSLGAAPDFIETVYGLGYRLKQTF